MKSWWILLGMVRMMRKEIIKKTIWKTNSRCECGGIRYTVGEVPPLEFFLKWRHNGTSADVIWGEFLEGGKNLKFTPQQKFPQSDKDENCGGSRDDEIVKGEINNFLWFWGQCRLICLVVLISALMNFNWQRREFPSLWGHSCSAISAILIGLRKLLLSNHES